MINILKKIFGKSQQPDFSEMLKNGGIIIDVRTKGEYSTGHIKDSKNIPLNVLNNNLNKIKGKDKPVITCCASGMRSASARKMLQSYGYTQVYNGGGWRSLQNKIS
ncbi:MAG: rhodanese-like domain-containing protein [Salinimicrobium sp.]